MATIKDLLSNMISKIHTKMDAPTVTEADNGKILGVVDGAVGLVEQGSGLPEGVSPYQQLVTDGEGNWVVEDRLAYTAMEEGESIGGSDGGFQWVENNGIYTSSAITSLSSDLVEGQTYCVFADEETIFLKAKKTQGMVYLGNASFAGQMEDTGEPFFFLDGRSAGIGIMLAAKIEYKTFFILTAIETIHPIPAEYLPEPIMLFLVVENSDGTLSASATPEELLEAYANGKTLTLQSTNGFLFGMSSVYTGKGAPRFAFSGVDLYTASTPKYVVYELKGSTVTKTSYSMTAAE